MAKQPKQKQDWGGAEAERFLVEAQARMAEAQRIKSYQEILNAGQQNLENPRFAQTGAGSAYDAASPYYGNQMQQQYEAAAQYANQLAATESPKVTIPESYYKEFTRQVPITIGGNNTPAYNVDRDVLQMPNPALYKAYMQSVGEYPENVSHNNYAPNALSPEQISANLMDYWRNTMEHEAAHIPDREVKFAEKPPLTISTHTGAAFDKPTYMAQEHHLVTGLGKVQREQYSMTGKRFESPEEFKSFIFNLAKSENPEEAISSFSEEARRTLRPQIENAARIKKYEDLFNAWKNNKSWFKGSQPMIPANPDLLEKSSQLIPALVSNYTSENYTS